MVGVAGGCTSAGQSPASANASKVASRSARVSASRWEGTVSSITRIVTVVESADCKPTTDGGRLFYDDAMAMNFQTMRARLADIFGQIDQFEDKPDAPPVYLASIDMHGFFDGLHEANHVDLGNRSCLASIWMGTRTRIAAHNDMPDNLACVAVGRRRFTLFPREQ